MGESHQNTRRQKLNERYEELIKIHEIVKGPFFQKFFMVPMCEERTKLKNAYDCDSLKDLHEVKGKKWGIQKFFEITTQIEQDAKFTKKSLDDLDRGPK